MVVQNLQLGAAEVRPYPTRVVVFKFAKFLTRKKLAPGTYFTFNDDNEDRKICVDIYPNGTGNKALINFKWKSSGWISLFYRPQVIGMTKIKAKLFTSADTTASPVTSKSYRKYISYSFLTNGKRIGWELFEVHSYLCKLSQFYLELTVQISGSGKVADGLRPISRINLKPTLFANMKQTPGDFLIVAGPEKRKSKIKMHSCVFACVSETFRAMMYGSNTVEKEQKKVEISNFPADIVEEMIHFIYNDKLKDCDIINCSDLVAIYFLADEYGVLDLSKTAMTLMRNRCNKNLIKGDEFSAAWTKLHGTIHAEVMNLLVQFAIDKASKLFSDEDFTEMRISNPEAFGELQKMMREKGDA